MKRSLIKTKIVIFLGTNIILLSYLLNEGLFDEMYRLVGTDFFFSIGIISQLSFALFFFIVLLIRAEIIVKPFVIITEAFAKFIIKISEKMPGKLAKGLSSYEKLIKKTHREINIKQSSMNEKQKIFIMIFALSAVFCVISTLAFTLIGPFEGNWIYRFNTMSMGQIQMTGAPIEKTNWAGIITFSISVMSLLGYYLFKDN